MKNEIKILDNFLIYNLNENLTQTQIKTLYNRGDTLKQILIYDYLIKDNQNILDFKETLENILLKTHNKVNSNTKKVFKFKNPKKEIILNGYKQNLSNDLFDKFPNLETKTELKQLYCLDEIYSVLNENRRNKINYSQDLFKLINSSIQSYENQLIAEKLYNKLNEFWKIIGNENYEVISSNKLENFEKINKSLEKISKEDNSDFEINNEVQRAKNYSDWLNKRIKLGIDFRKTAEFENHINYFDNINNKIYLSGSDSKKLKIKQTALLDLANILDHINDSKAREVLTLSKKYSEIISEYEYFYNNKRKLEDIIKNQKKLNKKIKKLNLKKYTSFFGVLKRKQLNNYLEYTNKNLNNIENFTQNRYLNPYFNEKGSFLIKEMIYLQPIKNWEKPISDYYDICSLKFIKSASNKKKLKMKKIESLLEKIDLFNTRVKNKETSIFE